MSSIGKRLAQARNSQHISQSQLCKMLGVSRGACSQWEKGHSHPSTIHIIECAKVLNVSAEWLITGRGEMDYRAHSLHAKAKIAEAPAPYYFPTLPADHAVLLNCYSKLKEDQKKAVVKLVESMI